MLFFALLLLLSSTQIKTENLDNSISQGKNMEHTIEKKDPFKIIGFAIKTSNQPGKAEKEISALWQHVMQKNLIAQIPGKVDNNIIAMYTDYEGDCTKPYIFILGAIVEKTDNVPEGMVEKTISPSNYAVFPLTDPLPQGIVTKWKEIWKAELARKYTSDFEIYTPSKNNPELLDANIYVAIED